MRIKQIAIIWLCVATAITPVSRGDSAGPRGPSESVSLGLAFLFQQQNFDGSFGPRDLRVGTTGLALLAFFASGNSDDGGRYAANIHRGLEYLTRESTPQSAGNEDRAIVALTLCQAYGIEPDEAFRQRIYAVAERSLKSLLAAQTNDGGWGAQPGDMKSDLSVSAWSAMALQSAIRIGIVVPKENLDRARTYVELLSKQPKPATAELVISLDGRRYLEALHSLSGEPANVQPLIGNLIHEQLADGSWNSATARETTGDVRSTSIAILIITMPLGLAPQTP